MLTVLVSEFKFFNEKTLEYTMNIETSCKFIKHLDYKTIINGKEIHINCPVYRAIPEQVLESIPKVIPISNPEIIRYIPTLIIPHKKYPVHVYLYAVVLYLSTSLSMRKVADKVCCKFNLKSFSHSTISRTIKKLISNYSNLRQIFEEAVCQTEHPCELNIRKKWDNEKKSKMEFLLKLLRQVLKAPEQASDEIAKEYFEKSQGKFLL